MDLWRRGLPGAEAKTRMMDLQKLDAALALALKEHHSDGKALEVSVRLKLPLKKKLCSFLQEAGVRGVQPGRVIFTGALDEKHIERLAQLAEVCSITLAQRLSPTEPLLLKQG